jgi:hypothetical protein
MPNDWLTPFHPQTGSFGPVAFECACRLQGDCLSLPAQGWRRPRRPLTRFDQGSNQVVELGMAHRRDTKADSCGDQVEKQPEPGRTYAVVEEVENAFAV